MKVLTFEMLEEDVAEILDETDEKGTFCWFINGWNDIGLALKYPTVSINLSVGRQLLICLLQNWVGIKEWKL